MFKLFKYFRKRDYLLMILCVALVVGNVWFELKLPEYMMIITKLIVSSTTPMSEILLNGAYMLGYTVLSVICIVFVQLLCAILSANLGQTLRSKLFSKTINFSTAKIKHFSTASLITRTTNDVTQIQNLFAMGLRMIIKAPTMAIIALCKIAASNFEWTLATVISVVIIIAVIATIIVVALPKFKKIQTLTDNLNRVTREGLTGARVVRAFNAEKYQEKKFDKANKEITDNHFFISKFMALLDPTITLIMNGLPLAIYIIGSILILNAGQVDRAIIFSQMTSFSTYAIQVVMSFIMLVFMFIMIPRAQVSANRINEVLMTENDIIDGEGTTPAIKEGEIQFVNVGFKYPDAEEYVLHDINLKIEKGQTVAFIGSTGSGKSTLINLVPRLYDATEGQVIVDGVNVKDYKLSQLNSKIGYIAQKAVLFSGTVKSNLLLGEVNDKKPSKENLDDAIDISQSKFIYEIGDGLDMKINQGGKNVSGGQKQRLSIARALARKPEILIFDDSFSALDYKTDKLLRDALKQKEADTTCLIVAQRIGTIKDADKIIVLDNGSIVGEGTHRELMKNCKIYKEIALSQLSKEELENA